MEYVVRKKNDANSPGCLQTRYEKVTSNEKVKIVEDLDNLKDDERQIYTKKSPKCYFVFSFCLFVCLRFCFFFCGKEKLMQKKKGETYSFDSENLNTFSRQVRGAECLAKSKMKSFA